VPTAARNLFGLIVSIPVVVMTCVFAAYHHAVTMMVAMVDARPVPRLQEMQSFAEDRSAGEGRQEQASQESSIHKPHNAPRRTN
jgi:hypothetical protein